MIETNEAGFTGTLWPVHLKPQADELLSSWLARLALAHGQTVASFTYRVWPRRNLVARDVDLWNDPVIFETLSTKTATPPDRVFAATLASYEGWLFDKPRQCHLPWMLPRYLNIRPHRHFGLQFCPWCLASDKEPYLRRQWRLAFLTLCPIHQTLLLDRCQRCGMAVCYERHTAEEPMRWTLTQCYRCRTDLRKFAKPRYRRPVESAELEFTLYLQTALQRGWVELPQNGVIYSHLFFDGLHHLIRRLTYGRMAPTLKAALSRSYDIDLPIFYLPGESFIFERLQISQRRSLLQALNCLLRKWPDNFIEFCQANDLACDFLLGDRLHDLPFWYLRVVREHLNRAAHKVSDQEIITIVEHVRQGGDQPTAEQLRRFLSSEVVKRGRAAGLIKRKEYLGLCPHCHATKTQFKSGLSRHGSQQFRCGDCRRRYQFDYESGRIKPRNSAPISQPAKHQSFVASVGY
jgi:hypothetical protein